METTEQTPPATETAPTTEASGTEAPAGTLLEGAKGEEKDSTTQEGSEESKPEGEGQKAEGETAKSEGAPEAYEDFKAPEGIELNSGVIDEFKGLAKELGLSQDKAQGVLDRMLPAMAQRQAAYIQEVAKGWAERTEKDQEVGGTNFQGSLASVARLRDRFAYNEDGSMDADIKEFLSSPMGNHPGAVKLLARAGKAMGEAQYPHGGGAPKRAPTATDFYESARKK